MAGEKDTRRTDADEAIPDAPGVPGAYGKGAAPGEEEAPRGGPGEGMPEHRSMGQRSDLGEGDLEASEHEDQMSRSPSHS